MKRGSITRIRVGSDDPLPETPTDWARVDAMTEEEVLAAAASDPDARPWTEDELRGAQLSGPWRVRRLRERLGLTQEAFARTFRIPLGTLRDWEQGRKRPDAPARALLDVIEREPDAARRALAAAG